MSATMIQPYLFFGGRCDEAINFYQVALGATVDMVARYKDSPEPMPPGSLPAGYENKVMHASLRIGSTSILASDGHDEKQAFAGFALSLAVPTESDAHRAFDALANGGKVFMPLAKTFWSPCFGIVTDKFGVGWMVTVPAC